MRQPVGMIASGILGICCIGLCVPPQVKAGPIPDKNLEAAIRAVLHEPKGELTDEKLNNVFVLEVDLQEGNNDKLITDLTGLEKCKNLALLKLARHKIRDLKPLQGLTNLQSLDLSANQITDLTPLKGLIKLQYLELSNNAIDNVEPLAGLTNLASLYLSGNKIADLKPLAGLTRLASLSLARNRIVDLSALTKINRLTTLDLSENQIEDITPLRQQTELSLLMLQGNKIRDLSALVAAVKADYDGPKRFAPYLRLYLAGNPLSDAARTSQMAALRGYGVRIEG